MGNGQDKAQGETAGFRLAILTISDAGARGEREDTSGDVISELSERAGFREVLREIVPDEKEIVSQRLAVWCDEGEVDVILTTGGTGLGPRDVTPEATEAVIEFAVPGISEAIRIQTLRNTPMAMLSRAVAGVRSGCIIINLPGSPKGVRECLEVAMPAIPQVAIPHALEMMKGWRGHPEHLRKA